MPWLSIYMRKVNLLIDEAIDLHLLSFDSVTSPTSFVFWLNFVNRDILSMLINLPT